jgi:hypothetical protein
MKFGLAVVLGIFGYARYNLTGIPLDRDEGAYAYVGQLDRRF